MTRPKVSTILNDLLEDVSYASRPYQEGGLNEATGEKPVDDGAIEITIRVSTCSSDRPPRKKAVVH